MAAISCARRPFPPDVIRHAAWLYPWFALRCRDVQEMPAERGLERTYETVKRRVATFGLLFVRA